MVSPGSWQGGMWGLPCAGVDSVGRVVSAGVCSGQDGATRSRHGGV